MNSKAPLEIKTQLDHSVAESIAVLDEIMTAMSKEKFDRLTQWLQIKEMPADIRDVDPVEACKIAAILGLKVTSQISRQKDAQLSKIKASN